MNAEHLVQSSLGRKDAGCLARLRPNHSARNTPTPRSESAQPTGATRNRFSRAASPPVLTPLPRRVRPQTMKLLARYLYIVAHSIDPNGLGLLCTVAFAALLFGMMRVGPWAREIIRRGVARFSVCLLPNNAGLGNMPARAGFCHPA